jgi:tetratricopeptide (TPR) repeat protein
MEHTPGSGRIALRGLGLAVLGALLLTPLTGLTGCTGKRGETSGASGEEAAGQRPARAGESAEWAWLQDAKKALDAEREELSQARSQEKAAAAKPGSPATRPDLAALEKDVAARGDELNRRLVGFINANPPAEGEKPAGRLRDAVRMKSDEEIHLAHQFIEQGGDYRRAIEIYEAALSVDPDNPRLQGELAGARAHRYMTAEHFSQVKKGMTQDEVRAVLGQPNVRDVRDFPERGVSAWFYTKDADGRAAAVWFANAKEKGGPTVYQADFNAVDLPRAPKS